MRIAKHFNASRGNRFPTETILIDHMPDHKLVIMVKRELKEKFNLLLASKELIKSTVASRRF